MRVSVDSFKIVTGYHYIAYQGLLYFFFFNSIFWDPVYKYALLEGKLEFLILLHHCERV